MKIAQQLAFNFRAAQRAAIVDAIQANPMAFAEKMEQNEEIRTLVRDAGLETEVRAMMPRPALLGGDGRRHSTVVGIKTRAALLGG